MNPKTPNTPEENNEPIIIDISFKSAHDMELYHDLIRDGYAHKAAEVQSNIVPSQKDLDEINRIDDESELMELTVIDD